MALVLCAWLLAACDAKALPVSAVPESPQVDLLTGLKDCAFQANGSQATYAAECGVLTVPENRDKVDSRSITLPVVRIPASGPKPAEPVFFLNGGPGQSNLSWAPPDWLIEDHDVVLVGYRGVDGAVVLDCPEWNRLFQAHMGKDLFSEQARAGYAAAVRQCAAEHQAAGVDVAGYTIPGVIGDLEAARTALGYGRINLFSLSYGTRVAQIYAYAHPDSLHRLVLIGVNTPGHFIWDPAVIDTMIRRLGALCAQAAACSRRTDDLARTMYTINHNMPERWQDVTIDPDTVRYGTHMLFFSNRTIPLALDAYLAAAEGDPSGLALLGRMASRNPLNLVIGDVYSKGGPLDLDRFHGMDSISLGDSIMGAPLSEAAWSTMADWPIELVSDDLREFQESQVEMLLVNGTVDFSTPPTALEEARPFYHNAQMVILPEFSHVDDVMNLQPEAFEKMIVSYYAAGTADASLFVYQPVAFQP